MHWKNQTRIWGVHTKHVSVWVFQGVWNIQHSLFKGCILKTAGLLGFEPPEDKKYQCLIKKNLTQKLNLFRKTNTIFQTGPSPLMIIELVSI